MNTDGQGSVDTTPRLSRPEEFLIPSDVILAWDKVAPQTALVASFTKADLDLLMWSIINAVQSNSHSTNAQVLASNGMYVEANSELQLALNRSSASLSDIRKFFTNIASAHLGNTKNAAP